MRWQFWVGLVLCVKTCAASGQPVTVSPSALVWNIVQVGTTSTPKQVTVTNGGATALSLSAPTITGAAGGDIWTVVPANTNGCGSSLATNTSCSYTVTFTPGGVNARHALLHVSDNLGSHIVTLSGTGTLVKVSIPELSFGNVTIGNKLSKTFTITNVSSSLTLNFTAPQVVAGPDPSDFSISGCTGSLAPQTSCTETATLTPSASGNRDAVAWIYDNGGPSPQYIYLVGIGIRSATSDQLTVAANPSAGGTVSPVSGTYYAAGTVVNLTATPKSGSYFKIWTGPGASAVANTSSANTTITMNAPESVTANFLVIPSYVVTVNSDDASGVASNCPAGGPSGGSGANCSLRDALAAAETAGTGNISFNGTVFNANKSAAQNTITLTSFETLNIPSNTTISGPTTGSGATLTNLVTVNGANATTVFSVGSTVVNAEIFGLTISGGSVNGYNFPGQGGGIDNGGTLTITNSTISGNSTNWELGGGGIFNSIGATLTLLNSTVSGNSANFTFFPDSLLCLGGGGIYNDGTLMVINSTIVGNSTADCVDGGGSILNDGGGAMTLTNSTIAGNSVSNAPDTGVGDGPVFSSGGGINNLGTMILANSIVAGNTAPTSANISGPYTNRGGNIANVSSPDLAPLGNFGGPTQTAPPLAGSPANCAGSISNIPSGVTTDQRGLPRTTNHNGKNCVDAGAVQTNY